MKKLLSLTLVFTILIACVGCGKTDEDTNTTSTTESTTTTTTTETSTTTTTTTEESSETSTKTQEETTTKKTETITKKQETTTRKPVTTTKKPETTTKKPVTTTENNSGNTVNMVTCINNKCGKRFDHEKNQFCPYCGRGYISQEELEELKYCEDCGKKADDGTSGTCVQFVKDKNCPKCNEFCYKFTCHTCK